MIALEASFQDGLSGCPLADVVVFLPSRPFSSAIPVPMPIASPMLVPTTPMNAPCSRKIPMMRFELVPMARRIPISFCFCTTLTTSTLDMPSATMMTTKLRIRLFETDWLRSAASNCELVVIQLSTVMPLPA